MAENTTANKRGRKPSNTPTRSTSVTLNQSVYDAIEETRWEHRATFSGMLQIMAEKFLADAGKPVTLAAAAENAPTK